MNILERLKKLIKVSIDFSVVIALLLLIETVCRAQANMQMIRQFAKKNIKMFSEVRKVLVLNYMNVIGLRY
jgi:hypothetical protein